MKRVKLGVNSRMNGMENKSIKIMCGETEGKGC